MQKERGIPLPHHTYIPLCVPTIRGEQPILEGTGQMHWNIEIKQAYHTLTSLQNTIRQTRVKITETVPEADYKPFFDSQKNYHIHNLAAQSSTTKKKFHNIIAAMAEHNNSTPGLNQAAIHNGTDKQIPHEAAILLSLGPKFALPPHTIEQIPFFHLLADVENILHTKDIPIQMITRRKVPDPAIIAVQNANRCKITNNIHNYLHQFLNNPQPPTPLAQFLKTSAKATREFLRTQKELVVLKADKGNKTVIMNGNDYKSKMLALLSDTKTYATTNRDPTSSIQSKNNEIVKRLRRLDAINDRLENDLMSRKALCPRIYGQPKAHKAGLPLRPVVPNMTAPTYTLSKFVGQILQSSLQSAYNIRDSYSFCDYINGITLPADYVLVSLDVVSLFTCIPFELVRRDVTFNWSDIQKHTNINLEIMLEIIEFIMKSCYFTFEGKFYSQIFGTAMGNPLSSPLADLVMENLMHAVVKKLDFQPPVLKKYVDDLIVALPLNKLKHVQDSFNSYSQHIQFTYELEENRRLPYLDMVLVRTEAQQIRTEWYRKPISSGRFLDFYSCHTTSQKVNTAMNFIQRVDKLSTNLNTREKMKIVDKELEINHYPKPLRRRLINNQLCNRSNNGYQQQQTQLAEPSHQQTNICYRSIPNIPTLSQTIAKTLKQDYPEVRLAVRNTNTVGSCFFSNMKDKVPTENHTNVIYAIPCNECESSYIGMTTTQLKTRMSSHKCDIKRLNELLQAGHTTDDYKIAELRQKTALLEHSISKQHSFDTKKVRILDQHNRGTALPILEMCHIMNNNQTVNKRTDTDGLSIIYAGLLHTLKTKNYKHRKPNTVTPSGTEQQ